MPSGASKLTPEHYHVLREHGTERAGTSPLDKNTVPGSITAPVAASRCSTPATKFNSGTGWPSFSAPLDGAVETETDRSFFMMRTEVHCRRCGGHLGHVFDDGPQPTGLALLHERRLARFSRRRNTAGRRQRPRKILSVRV